MRLMAKKKVNHNDKYKQISYSKTYNRIWQYLNIESYFVNIKKGNIYTVAGFRNKL